MVGVVEVGGGVEGGVGVGGSSRTAGCMMVVVYMSYVDEYLDMLVYDE